MSSHRAQYYDRVDASRPSRGCNCRHQSGSTEDEDGDHAATSSQHELPAAPSVAFLSGHPHNETPHHNQAHPDSLRRRHMLAQ